MNPVTAKANPGTLIQLDQCGQCGGIWCDKWELFPIDPDEAERLDSVDEKLLTAPGELATKTVYCPRCTGKLQSCSDPMLPKDLQLKRCWRCDGIWLNRGELKRFKKHQGKTRTDKLGAEAIVRKISDVYQNPKSWVVTGTQGMFVYPRGAVEEKQTVGETLSGAAKLILQTLMRMVLGI
jgi:Zn-finger nucleic acid-binding protein